MSTKLFPLVGSGSFCCFMNHPKHKFLCLVDWTSSGRNSAPVEVASLTHYFQRYIDPRWYKISSINCTKGRDKDAKCLYSLYTLLVSDQTKWSFPWVKSSMIGILGILNSNKNWWANGMFLFDGFLMWNSHSQVEQNKQDQIHIPFLKPR